MFFLVAVLIFAFGFFFQQFHWLAIGGINPNLALIFFQWLAVSRFSAGGFSWPKKVTLALVFTGLIFLINGFWLWPAVALFAVFLLSSFFKNFLTGNIFFDFGILLIGGGLIFYFLTDFGRWEFLPWPALGLELIYSLILGEWLLFLFNDQKEG